LMYRKARRPAQPYGDENNNIVYYLFFPLSIIFMEMVIKIFCFGTIFDQGAVYTLIFSVSIGLAAAFFSSLMQGTGNRIVSVILTLIITLVFGIQAVYFKIFNTFVTLFSVTGAGEAFGEFWKEALEGIAATAFPLLFLFIPFIILLIFGRRITPARRPKARVLIAFLLVGAALHLANIALIKNDDEGIMSDDYVYSDSFSPVLLVPRFGILTTLRLDIENMISYKPEAILEEIIAPSADVVTSDAPSPSETAGVSDDISPTPTVYGKNVMNIDFDKLIAEEDDSAIKKMHEYFSAVTPTSKNEYTGMFEDYNLVWIVAEGFSSLALDKTHTPTLSKLAGEGFVFNNFYNPVWGVSTSDGEYVATTGLIPKSGVWSYFRSADNYMPFGFGNMFSPLGYTARAYHNNTYTYYNRDKSYPNMGYDYKAIGNGLELKKQWPMSDLEMVEKTVPDYIGDNKFLVYYMTVSGHLNYTFTGNMMAYRHKSEVADLPYTEKPRAYIACQMEFDLAVKKLIDELDLAGILDKTVIVISGDHYPYGLEQGEMEEIAGQAIETNFELYRSTLIIWNSEIESVEVDKYCSSLDIMPTLANLFGREYDSRLVMGTDILSDSDPLVVFNNRSFITDLGRYNSTTDTFTKNEGAVIPEHYARDILSVVNNKFEYSADILTHDYYQAVFNP
jgi:lipoteichoic acid synthase